MIYQFIYERKRNMNWVAAVDECTTSERKAGIGRDFPGGRKEKYCAIRRNY